MKFSYHIKNADSFSGEVREMGETDLENAITYFQNFPFEEVWKTAKMKADSPERPTITIKSEDGKSLTIWSDGTAGFSFSYFNGKQVGDAFLAADVTKNPKGYSIEMFIEKFFDQTIEPWLNLVDYMEEPDATEMDTLDRNKGIVTFTTKENKGRPYVFWIMFLLLNLVALRMSWVQSKSFSEVDVFVSILLGFFWLPGVYLQVSYWLHDKSSCLIINTKDKTLERLTKMDSVKFNRNEVLRTEIHEGRRPQYSFLKIMLNDGRNIVITSLTVDPGVVPELLGLPFKTIKRFIPTI